MTRRKVGSTRERLAQLLLAKGLIVTAEDLWTQEGFYRSKHHDLARWGSNHARWVNGTMPDGKPWHGDVILSSWSTMTECVKGGVEISEFDGWSHVDVSHCG